MWGALAEIPGVSKGEFILMDVVSELISQGAVARNTSLTTLLEQAREEHPLASQEGLAGTAWDRDTK